MYRLADVNPIVEHFVEGTLIDQLAVAVSDVLLGELLDQLGASELLPV